MLRRIELAFAVTFLASSSAVVAGAQHHSSPPTAPSSLWVPTPFETPIQPGYSGLDLKSFYAFVNARVGDRKKGEFETTGAYDARFSDVGKSLAPLGSASLIAFVIPAVKFVYNADSQSYAIEGFLCMEAPSYVESNGFTVCRLGPATHTRDSYAARNAFGTTVSVTRTTEDNLAFAVPNGSKFLQSAVLDRSEPLKYPIKDVLPMSVANARALAGKTLAALIVGRVTAPKFLEGESFHTDPKINVPFETFTSDYALPFEPTKLYYYVKETGEVLKQVDL